MSTLQKTLLEKLAQAAASGIDWRPILDLTHAMLRESSAAHSEIATGQLLTAAVALFDDGTLTPAKRREVWEGLTKVAYEVTEHAHAEGLLRRPSSEQPRSC
jgi:hypothetical protein